MVVLRQKRYGVGFEKTPDRGCSLSTRSTAATSDDPNDQLEFRASWAPEQTKRSTGCSRNLSESRTEKTDASRHQTVFGKVTPQSLGGIVDSVEQGKLAPTIGRTVPLSEAIPAIIELEKTSLPRGKLMIIPVQ